MVLKLHYIQDLWVMRFKIRPREKVKSCILALLVNNSVRPLLRVSGRTPLLRFSKSRPKHFPTCLTQPGFSNEFIFCTKWEFYCNSSCREMGSIWMIGSRKEADLGKFSYPHFFSYSRFSTLALRDAIIDRHGGQQGVAYSPVHTKSWKEGGCKGLSYLSKHKPPRVRSKTSKPPKIMWWIFQFILLEMNWKDLLYQSLTF